MAGFDGVVRILDVLTGRELRRMAKGNCMENYVVYTPDGKTVAAGGFNLAVVLWDAASGAEKQRFVGYDGLGLSGRCVFRFSPDGKWLVAPIRRGASRDGAARPAGATKDALRFWFNKDLGPTGEADGKTRLALWDVTSGKRLRVFGPPTEFGPADLAFTPDGKVLAVADRSDVHLIDVQTGEEKSRFSAAGGRLGFKWDDRLFVGKGCYDVSTGKKMFEVPASPTWQTAVSANGEVFVVGEGEEATAVVWNLHGGRPK